MTQRARRSTVAAGLAVGLLGLTFQPVAAHAGPSTYSSSNDSPLRVVAAATDTMVEVFAGNLSTTDTVVSEETANTLSAAYKYALANPTELSVPYVSDGAVVAPYTSTAGARLVASLVGGVSKTSPIEVAHSLAELDKIKFEVGGLTTAPFNTAGITDVFIEAEHNRVIVEVPTATAALRQALTSRYGSGLVAIHLHTQPPSGTADDGRANDNGNFEGGSDFSTSVGGCTTGFAFYSVAQGDMMVTAGHCTTYPGTAYSPNGGTLGTTEIDNWSNSSGSVITSGLTTYHGDVSAIEIASGATSTAYVHNGAPLPANSTARLPVRDRLHRYLVVNDQFCSDGSRSGELCGWHVTQVQITHTYSNGTVLRNGFRAEKTSGNCLIGGDSGAPLYARNSTSITLAVGIFSGGTYNATGSASNPCVMWGTEMEDVWLQVPGDIKTTTAS